MKTTPQRTTALNKLYPVLRSEEYRLGRVPLPALCLLLCVFGFPGATNALAQSTVTLHPSDDAYVNDSNRNGTYNTAWLVVGRSPQEFLPRYRTYLRFDLSAIPSNATINYASLRLNLQASEGASNVSIELRRVLGAWTEASLTWNNQPANAPPLLNIPVGPIIGRYYQWTVTDLVQSWVQSEFANHGMALRILNETNEASTRTFASSENGNAMIRPQLFVRYTLPQEISVTPTQLAFGQQLLRAPSLPQTVTVQNTGGANLRVTRLACSSSEFVLSAMPSLPAIVAPGSNLTFQVRFTPVGLGPRTGAISIASDDPNQAQRILSCIGMGVGPTIVRGPYLQIGTPTSAIIRWRTAEESTGRVFYGLDPAALNWTADGAPATTEHIVSVVGLSPDTTYYYAIGTSDGPLPREENFYFTTVPTVGTDRATRVWVIGDSGTANDDAGRVRDAYLDLAGDSATDVWLMLGDNAYLAGRDLEYQAAVFDMYPALLPNTFLWPALGNHETYSADADGSFAYLDIFSLPTAAEAGGSSSGTERYYSFDYANIHFICLDSMTSDRATDGAMLTWLQEDLASTAQDWIIAYWHHPPYSKGSHDSDRETELIEMRENALPILEAAGVDLVLCGHSHSYERSFFLDGHYQTSDHFLEAMKIDPGDGREEGDGPYIKAPGAANSGAVYSVVGSSGQISGGTLDHPAMFASLSELGSLVLDIAGDRLDATFLRDNGTTPDHYTIIKGQRPDRYDRAPLGNPPNDSFVQATALPNVAGDDDWEFSDDGFQRLWRINVEDLNFHTFSDADYFSLSLPAEALDDCNVFGVVCPMYVPRIVQAHLEIRVIGASEIIKLDAAGRELSRHANTLDYNCEETAERAYFAVVGSPDQLRDYVIQITYVLPNEGARRLLPEECPPRRDPNRPDPRLPGPLDEIGVINPGPRNGAQQLYWGLPCNPINCDPLEFHAYLVFNWGQTRPLELEFQHLASNRFDFELLDVKFIPLARAELVVPNSGGSHDTTGTVTQQLRLSSLPPGVHFLRVGGSALGAPYTVRFVTPGALAVRISQATAASNGFHFRWTAEPGRRYQVQYKDQLSDPTWSNLGGPITAGGSTISVPDPTAGRSSRFYRVVQLD